MSFRCGLVGMPNVGKSSIFNLLTNQKIPAENYPFCTIDPNSAFVKVPDTRLDTLVDLNNSENKVNAAIEFVDIAGLIKGASTGEGLGNDFLTHIMKTDVIAHVVRFFKDDDIIHVNGSTDPLSDFRDINLELILADLSTTEKYLNSIKKSKKPLKNKNELIQDLEKLIEHLSREVFASKFKYTENLAELTDLKLLTNKPMFVIANIDENNDSTNKFMTDNKLDLDLVAINAALEQEIALLSEQEQKEFLSDLGLADTALERIIKTGYKLLGLKTFFTSGPKESRAWSAKKTFNAIECSGIIHSDIKQGFIRAETVSYENYIKFDGEQGSKNNGVWRQEGKDYLVQEGDVIYFRFNI